LPCPEGFRGWILALVLPVHSPHPPTKFVTFFCPLRSNGCKPMKTFIKNLFLVPALIAGFGLIPAGRVTAQTFTTLYSLTGSDGYQPSAGLIISGNKMYGTAYGGGSSDRGTVFAVNTDGTGFTNLHSLTYAE